MPNIVKVTENSWLVRASTQNMSGLLQKKNDDIYFLTTTHSEKFDNFNDFEDSYGKIKIVDKSISNEDIIVEINGYTVKHKDVIIIDDGDIPLYKKTETSDIVYAAGYWLVEFASGWVKVLCPKTTTLTENEFKGPYKTNLEAAKELSNLR